MLISISYCRVCNYYPIAARLAIDLKQEFDCEVEFTPDKNGAFEVYRDGELIFSKNMIVRFPNKGEILSILKGELPANPEK